MGLTFITDFTHTWDTSMNRNYFLGALLLATVVGWTFANGQQTPSPEARVPATTYRVISFPEMFAGDEEARQRLFEYMVHVKKGDEPQGVHRTDMDPKDYERALNRLAAEGWTLVAVNKSNYWVFKK